MLRCVNIRKQKCVFLIFWSKVLIWCQFWKSEEKLIKNVARRKTPRFIQKFRIQIKIDEITLFGWKNEIAIFSFFPCTWEGLRRLQYRDSLKERTGQVNRKQLLVVCLWRPLEVWDQWHQEGWECLAAWILSTISVTNANWQLNSDYSFFSPKMFVSFLIKINEIWKKTMLNF